MNLLPLINSLLMLALARGDAKIEVHTDHLGQVKQFFDNSLNFELDHIEAIGDNSTIHFKWKPLEEVK